MNPGRRRRPSGAGALLGLYPASWRRRYGDELDALIREMRAGGHDAGWRLRLDLIRSAARQHLRGGGDAELRIRGGASLVLWAWALFVLAGALVVKTSEHWQQTLPARGYSAAYAAFAGLTVVAVATAALVAAGIALTLPAAVRFIRDDGWPTVRGRALVALGLTIVAAPATVALVLWAHGLNLANRDGRDGLYAAAFLGWAALGAACLLAWTAVATRIARELRCRAAVLRAQALIAPVVAIAMVAMTGATVAWWAVVGHDAPAALTGGSAAADPSPLVAPLVVAGLLMVVATAIAAVGAVRADVALAEL